MSKIRIAHLSDLHLTRNNRLSRSEPKLYGRLQGMNTAFKTILQSEELRNMDWLFISGDVTDRGDLDTWHQFWETITDAGFEDRCLVVPGNHDVCNLGLSPFTRQETERAAQERLQRLRRGLRLGNQHLKFPWAQLIDKDIVVFGLDSSNHGNLSVATNAVGQLGFRQLEALARLLKKHSKVPVKIIMLHHSPNIPHKDTEIKRGLAPTSKFARWGHEVPQKDRQGLRLLAVTHGVQLILHGHLHREETRRVNGVRIVGAGATTEVKDSKGHKIDIYDVYKKSKKIYARSVDIQGSKSSL